MLLSPTISAYLKMSVNGVRDILSNLDILTISDLSILVNDLKIISLSQLPTSVKPILESLAPSSTPVNNIENENGYNTLDAEKDLNIEKKLDSITTPSLDPLREASFIRRLNGSFTKGC